MDPSDEVKVSPDGNTPSVTMNVQAPTLEQSDTVTLLLLLGQATFTFLLRLAFPGAAGGCTSNRGATQTDTPG